ncbi:MAG: tetratricopeptide repeat protein [Chloroflexi bacterium]|nr:tetratricopeptide repeat protein [Chloroflexota bacterium]
MARSGDAAGAQAAYQRYVAAYPTGEDAPFAAWWAAPARKTRAIMPGPLPITRFLADVAPFHEDAPEALFRAGWLAYWNGDAETAVSRWQRSVKLTLAQSSAMPRWYGCCALCRR